MKKRTIMIGLAGLLGLSIFGLTANYSNGVEATETNDSTTEKTLIIDGSKLTSTVTTNDLTKAYDGIDIVFSKGAKQQKSTKATSAFSDNAAILIGKSGAYIYNKTPLGNKITKFEVYANEGASSKVSIGISFGSSELTKYNATGAYTAALSNTNSVYDASGKLGSDSKFFWYQVINAFNSQVQFKITYEQGEVINPTSVKVSLSKDKLTQIGSTAQATAIVLPENATDKTIVWSSSNESVATVDKETGIVTAKGNGSADIIATCVANSEVVGKKSITVDSPEYGIENDVYLTANSLGLTSKSYVDNNKSHSQNNISYTTNQVMLTSDSMQFQKNAGTLSNDQSYASPIKAINILLGDGSITLNAGSSKETLANVTSNQKGDYKAYNFEKSDDIKYFNINAGSSTTKIALIIIELYDDNMEQVRAYSEMFNETMEPVCLELNGIATDDWSMLSELYGSLTEGQKAIIENSSKEYICTEISKCIQRYDYIVAKYSSLDNFMNREIQTSKSSMIIGGVNNQYTLVLASLLSAFAVSSICLFVFLQKKRKA